MTEQQHPITPTPKMLQQWKQEWLRVRPSLTTFIQWMLAKSARWGYEQRGADIEAKLQKARDEELDACCEWLKSEGHEYEHEALFAARRPKPPSLKAQALEALKHAEEGWRPVPADCAIIRRALEQLDD